MIDYGSVCSGIEAATVAVHPLGWKPAWFAEIEDFPSRVLAHHYPHVNNLGDMTLIAREVLAGRVHAPSLLVGGTPCQAFSVAGMRAGLKDQRGQLTIKFVELADAIDHVRTARGDDECVVWWENVPGVLSDKENAFGCFLAALVGESDALQPAGGRWTDAGCVYGPTRTVAWRVLDAQYFGLAQRRRRVFVVASARAGFDPASVLFEREGVRRDHPPSRGAGQDVTGTIAGGARQSGGYSTDDIPLTAYTLQAAHPKADRGEGANLICMAHGQPNAEISVNRSPTLTCNHEAPIVAKVSGTLGANHGNVKAEHAWTGQLVGGSSVRRLTPRECEQLQGFPINYTRIPMRFYKSRKISDLRPADMWEKVEGGWMLMAADGPRYKAIGNSKATTVVRWIAQRIDAQVRILERENDNNPATAGRQVG